MAGRRHAARMYGALVIAYLHARLSYRADFAISLISVLALQGAGLVLAWTVLAQRPAIAGWTFSQLALLYGLAIIPRGCSELFTVGQWHLPQLVNTGQLDRMLVRPLPVVLQVFTHEVGAHGLGNIALGIALVARAHHALALSWDGGQLALLCAVVVSSSVLLGSAALIANCLVFWVPGGSSEAALLVFHVAEVAKFPLSIYGRVATLVLTWVIPIGFVSYYPSLVLLAKPEREVGMAWLSVPVGLACWPLAQRVWRAALGRYDGAGN